MSRAEVIRENLVALERRVVAACELAGRQRHHVTLVAVTKTFPADDVAHAIAAGATDVGENKVQEARDKKPLVPDVGRGFSPPIPVAGRAEAAPYVRWHLIGHLQSNKAKDAVRLFDVIQSVDSFELAEKLARVAESMGKRQEVLLQVNVGREAQKSGVEVAEVTALAKQLAALPSLHLAGLMAIPPAGEAEAMRPYFRELRALRDDLGLAELSMGMTDDFEVAIEEGATIIRVGRAIFGMRSKEPSA